MCVCLRTDVMCLYVECCMHACMANGAFCVFASHSYPPLLPPLLPPSFPKGFVGLNAIKMGRSFGRRGT